MGLHLFNQKLDSSVFLRNARIRLIRGAPLHLMSKLQPLLLYFRRDDDSPFIPCIFEVMILGNPLYSSITKVSFRSQHAHRVCLLLITNSGDHVVDYFRCLSRLFSRRVWFSFQSFTSPQLGKSLWAIHLAILPRFISVATVLWPAFRSILALAAFNIGGTMRCSLNIETTTIKMKSLSVLYNYNRPGYLLMGLVIEI